MTSAATANYVSISPLVVGGEIVIPSFDLSADISNWGIRPVGRNGEQNYKNFPTLAQLRHAFETDKQITSNIRGHRYKGEHTATFLRDGKEAIAMPERVYLDEKSGLWDVEDGKATKVELPQEGWILEHDKPTGLPSRTSKRKQDAVKVFGDDASYFFYYTDGLYAVGRGYGWRGGGGPFLVGAGWRPDGGRGDVGFRPVQGSGVLTEPTLTEYERGKKELLEAMQRDFRQMPPEEFQRTYNLK